VAGGEEDLKQQGGTRVFHLLEFRPMSRLSNWKVLSVCSAALLCAALTLNLALAQTKPAAKAKAVAAAQAKPKGRLPAYYKDIVDEKQKEAIYSIQADYKGKIDALEEQIEKLTTDRDAAVENVLTAVQKDKLKKAKQAGATKKKKAEDKPAEEGAPAE
jgi:hypothetical protein